MPPAHSLGTGRRDGLNIQIDAEHLVGGRQMLRIAHQCMPLPAAHIQQRLAGREPQHLAGHERTIVFVPQEGPHVEYVLVHSSLLSMAPRRSRAISWGWLASSMCPAPDT